MTFALEYAKAIVIASLVPRPLPVFNDTRKKREGLVREVTCTSFRWKGGGRVIIVRGPVTCLRVVLAVPIGHRLWPMGTASTTRKQVTGPRTIIRLWPMGTASTTRKQVTGPRTIISAGHRYSHRSSSSDRRSSVILLHVQVYGFSSPVHLRCRVRACLSLREAIGL